MITSDNMAECIREADILAKDPTNFFRKLTDDRLARLTEAHKKYSRAINFMMCNKSHLQTLPLLLKRLDVLKRTPEITQFEISNEYIKLAEIQEKINVSDAIESYLNAITIFSENGQFDKRQKFLVKVGKLYEQTNKEKALEYYISALGCDNNYRVNIEIARVSIELEKYEDALNYYEKLADECVNNTVLIYSCREHFFKAILCGICVHSSNFKDKYLEYVHNNIYLQGSIEAQLLDEIFIAIYESNDELFQSALLRYDNIKKFDNIQTQLLLYIKKKILNEDVDLL